MQACIVEQELCQNKSKKDSAKKNVCYVAVKTKRKKANENKQKLNEKYELQYEKYYELSNCAYKCI